jgi:flavin-dependent thymidylate synthase
MKPKTYLIGYTNLNLDGLKNYLKDTDQEDFLETLYEAEREHISSGEILCSFYAKLCYKSLVVGKNKNISRTRDIEANIKSCMDTGHGCYDELTEVLTREGWKFWSKINNNDVFATMDKNGIFAWQSPSKIYSSTYIGKMINYDSNHIDLLITPNHNILACKTTTKNGRKKEYGSYDLYRAEELINTSHSMLKCLPYQEELQLIKDYQLLGFSIGDGHIRNNKIEFRLKKLRKINYLKSIAIVEEKDSDKYIVNIPDSLNSIFKQIYNSNKEKCIPRSIFDSIDNNIFYSIYDGLINSDGCIQETGLSYDTTSYQLAGEVQLLCCLLGYSANISQAKSYKDRKVSFGDKPIYRLSIITRSNKPDFNKSSDAQYQKPTLVDYGGMIYCCEVPNHILYVRRNGKPVWCGNSVFEHCWLNFVTTNCSRVFTHELVRHRAGTAFSQTSGRYVAIDQLDLVIDPILEPASELIEKTRKNLEDNLKELRKQLIEDADIKDFSTKKKITSAIRRLAPNGQTNEIGWSCNIRSLRHLIEMRTGRHAEWEIRLIFNQVADLVKDKFPTLLYNAKIEEVDGLLEYSNLHI